MSRWSSGALHVQANSLDPFSRQERTEERKDRMLVYEAIYCK